MDKTDELTNYEYEYEWLLEHAYNQILADTRNKQKVSLEDGKLERQFSMDEDEYNHIVELVENDEFIDFEIPKNAPMGKKLSEATLDIEKESVNSDDLVPVDMNEVFGGGIDGR
ncbi:hypothetical protein LSG31_00365 [Fodinisporobacter ferrooxydans]|uniref:Uncharacterized protein n=1 Tax=Fodinisporobacter ferrooxydans TaxID=2901836 RepID=A0ABY4CNF3_9BACL|nr:hypothetical protein LSG31_00365 [Alicyclobacillaceae bacterium MYW30-H2]